MPVPVLEVTSMTITWTQAGSSPVSDNSPIKGLMRKLWNPFSKQGQQLRLEAKGDLLTIKALREHAAQFNAEQELLLEEQRKLSRALRKERRKNHFAELFEDTIPIRQDSPSEV